jgi:hypothetical protein
MSIPRRAAKRDLNEREIIAYWERCGCWVESVSGKGTPDTRVHFDASTSWRAEVKGAKKGLTPAQVANFTAAHKHGIPTYVVRTTTDAANLLHATLEPWTPEDGALAGAARKEREHKPGYSKATRVVDLCAIDNCLTSRLPLAATCQAHLPKVTVDARAPLHVVREPATGQLRAPQPSGRRRRTP